MRPFFRRSRRTGGAPSLDRALLIAQNRALHRIADRALALAGAAADLGGAIQQKLAEAAQEARS